MVSSGSPETPITKHQPSAGKILEEQKPNRFENNHSMKHILR